MTQDPTQHVVQIAKVAGVNAAAVGSHWFAGFPEVLSALLMTASLIYTCAKLYELFTGRLVKNLFRRR